jgi:hypothetical protein
MLPCTNKQKDKAGHLEYQVLDDCNRDLQNLTGMGLMAAECTPVAVYQPGVEQVRMHIFGAMPRAAGKIRSHGRLVEADSLQGSMHRFSSHHQSHPPRGKFPPALIVRTTSHWLPNDQPLHACGCIAPNSDI